MFQREKTVLVAGGAGFIGSHLCRALLKSGYRVMCLDNLFTGKRENIADLESNSNFSFFEHDITIPVNYQRHIHWIINLATAFSAADCAQYPKEILKTLSLGVTNLLDLAVAKGSTFLQVSTSEVYGDPLECPQSESYRGNTSPTGLRSCYQEGSRFAESLVANYRKMHKTSFKIARVFDTYGPGMRLGTGQPLSDFINQVIGGKRLIVLGDPEASVCLCHVSDVVRGLVMLLQSGEDGPINLGSSEAITTQELAQRVSSLSSKSPEITKSEASFLYPANVCPDLTLAREKLNWELQ